MKFQKYLPIVAIIVLLVAIAATFFVNSNKIDATQIIIDGEEYTINQFFQMAEERSVQAETGESGKGVALDQLMQAIGIQDPETRQYTLISADGYQKTVMWENLQNGILSIERESVFSDLPKAFYVEEIVEIKVE
ncbi:MAG: hypothetical protein MIO92_05070 [Methanosarcinaceae archaeon]|nr:hypothetical protein [Methanosarcinaceae archaeon]